MTSTQQRTGACMTRSVTGLTCKPSEVKHVLTDSWRARLPKRGEMGPERGVPAGLAPWTGLKVKSSSEAPAA